MNTEAQSPKRAGDWSVIRRQIADWPKPALIALVKDLHDASPENRDFLRARFDAESVGGQALERYRRKIVEQFFPQRGFGKLKLAEARKAIRDYRKATANVPGTIDLMLTYVESSTEFTQQFGDINEAYYNSLESVLNALARLLRGERGGSFIRSAVTGWRAWSSWRITSAGVMVITFANRWPCWKTNWPSLEKILPELKPSCPTPACLPADRLRR